MPRDIIRRTVSSSKFVEVKRKVGRPGTIRTEENEFGDTGGGPRRGQLSVRFPTRSPIRFGFDFDFGEERERERERDGLGLDPRESAYTFLPKRLLLRSKNPRPLPASRTR